MENHYIFDTIEGEVLVIKRSDFDGFYEPTYDAYIGDETGKYLGEFYANDEEELEESINEVL